MQTVLVVSHACLVSNNRAIYRQLAQDYGWRVELIVPIQYKLATGMTKPEPEPADSNITVHQLEIVGNNPVTYFFRGIDKVVAAVLPNIIYLEADPISVMAVKLSRMAVAHKVHLVCISCENLSIGFFDFVRRKGLSAIPAAMVKQVLLYVARPNISHVCTINDAGTAIFRAFNYRSVSKIPLGFNPNVFFVNDAIRTKIRKELNWQNKTVVAYIGRLVPEKGVHILIETLARLVDNPDWRLMVDKFDFSKGEYARHIATLIEKYNLSERITYIEANHTEIANYMNAADVLVLPSISTKHWVEQYGRVVPESMACGKLVIASNVGALPELVGDAGIRFEEGSTDGLQSALGRCITQPTILADYKQKAVAQAVQFSILVQAEKLDSIFKTLLNN